MTPPQPKTGRRRHRARGHAPKPKKALLIPIEQDADAAQANELTVLPGLVFYCRKCRAATSPKQLPKRFEYRCPTCGMDVAFGTEKSVRNYYRLPGASA